MEHLALETELRQQLREGDIHCVLRGGVVEHRGDHQRVVVRRQRNRILLILRRQGERLRLDKVARWQEADDLLVGAARGLQLAFRRLTLRCCTSESGLGLGDVCAGDLADTETVVGRLQLFGEHLFVVHVQRQRLLRLYHANIGSDDIGEAGLLLLDQHGAFGHHLILGAIDAGWRLAAVVKRLCERRLRGADEPIRPSGEPELAVDPVAVAGGAGHYNGRSPAGQGLRHVLVGGPQLGALGKQLGLRRIGRGESLRQCVRRPGWRQRGFRRGAVRTRLRHTEGLGH